MLGVLAVLMLAASPDGGEKAGTASAPAPPSPADVPAPRDLSFLCDSLYTDYEEGRLASTEKAAAEAAAEGFVRTAYGYAGSDPEAYERGVEEKIVGDCFWGSPAAEEADATEEMVRHGGKASALGDSYYFFAGWVGFYVHDGQLVHHDSGAEYLRATGDAVWVSRPATGGGLDGRMQELTLVRKVGEEEWKVTWGEMVNVNTEYTEYDHVVGEEIEDIRSGG